MQKRRAAGLAIVAIGAFSGCANNTAVSPNQPLMSVANAESVLVSGEQARPVHIARSNSMGFSAIYYWPTVNGQPIAGVLTNQTLSFSVDPDKAKIGVACFGGWSKTWKHRVVTNLPSASEPVYLWLQPSKMFDKEHCARLTQISAEQYAKRSEGLLAVEVGELGQRLFTVKQ